MTLFLISLAALCQVPCQNGGRCAFPGRCSCPPGWTGLFCQTGTAAPHCTPLHHTALHCSPDPSVGTGSSTVARHQAWCSPEPRGEPVCELSAHTPTHPAPGSVPAGPAGKAGKLRAPCVSTGGARGRAQPWYPHLLFAAAPRWVSTSRGCALLRLQPAKGLVQSGRHTHGVSPRLYLQ